MGSLERIWRDIRRGENVDLYITVMVAIFLAVLNIINIVPATWITPLNLTVLALLSFAVLGNRYRIETILERITSKGELLLTQFPDDLLLHDIDKARELMILGVDLNIVLRRNYALLKSKLSRGDSIRIMLVDPESPVCEMAATLHYEPITCEEKRAAIHRSLRMLDELRRMTPGKLEIRLARHLPAFGAFVVDLETSDGAIYFWHYAFKAPDVNRLKLVFRHEDGFWYQSFKDEIGSIWNSATAWDAPDK